MLMRVVLLVCLGISAADVIKRKVKGSPVRRQAGCGVNEFQCLNGGCIQAEWTCDTDNDCGDNSDETFPASCPQDLVHCQSPHVVKCNNGNCVPIEFRCDGENDCEDNTDEEACYTFPCPPEEFKCATGMCININWQCDGDNDCGDGSDEVNC